MEETRNIVNFEDVHDAEIDDIWAIFFPNIGEKKERTIKLDQSQQTKPRRYLNFLMM